MVSTKRIDCDQENVRTPLHLSKSGRETQKAIDPILPALFIDYRRPPE